MVLRIAFALGSLAALAVKKPVKEATPVILAGGAAVALLAGFILAQEGKK